MSEPRTTSDPAEHSLGELVANLSTDLSRLVNQEITLAKTELKQEVVSAGQGAGLLGGAGVTGLFVAAFLSLALMFGLGELMHLGWAALIVAVLWGVAAAVLALVGKSKLSQATPPLEQTTQSLKEDAQWVKNRGN